MPSKGVALVTGAGQGIGRAIALRLADDGFEVAVNDTSADTLAEVVRALGEKACKSSMHVGDVSVDAQVRAMVEAVVKEHGGLDVMVANAGIVRWKAFLETTEDDWDTLFAVNAKGTFLCYKYAGAQMIAQGRGGRIIGACSVAGKRGSENMAAYSATKFAIRSLTQSAAVEFGPHGITVNAYAPGAIETALLQRLEDKNVAVNNAKPGEFLQALRDRAPVRFNGVPEDVAGLVSYLASKDSRFVTGQSISCNGGIYFD
ncbi:putative KR domain containing protein [Lyophyllum shimeji]|uniref:KR domain containing protein n=1 Tax=Lyophyllum shimeji TaxID=47721 RepID=A0A9P3PT56_LYOSH|nr:putative KR domain containing protein [Lyophyllum shimeji]